MGAVSLQCAVVGDFLQRWEKIAIVVDAIAPAIQESFPDCTAIVEELIYDAENNTLTAAEFSERAIEPGAAISLIQRTILVRRSDRIGAIVVVNWEKSLPTKINLTISQSIGCMESINNKAIGISVAIACVLFAAGWTALKAEYLPFSTGYVPGQRGTGIGFIVFAVLALPFALVYYIVHAITKSIFLPSSVIAQSEDLTQELKTVVLKRAGEPDFKWIARSERAAKPEPEATRKVVVPMPRKPMVPPKFKKVGTTKIVPSEPEQENK
jgi:hypothetical protein